MDCIEHAMSYRKNLVTIKDVATLFNSTMEELEKTSKERAKRENPLVQLAQLFSP
jgi:hypothetical protein